MNRLFRKGFDFVRNNQTIISSLLLIFVVIGALFLNSYVTLNRFQENLDKTLRGKAVLAENVIEIAAEQYFENLTGSVDQLENKFHKIKEEDSEISEISLFALDRESNELALIVGEETINEEEMDLNKDLIAQNARKFALSVDDAFAYLSNDEGQRYWNVAKSIRDGEDNIKGVLTMKLSLAENDALVEKTIARVYLLSVGAVVLVLLLIFNHLRLFSYEVKAKKLEEIDKMKDDFISMASHELKSPLTAISGYSELLSDTLVKGSGQEIQTAQRKYLGNINISIERLKTLVEDLLDVSRIEQGRLSFDCKRLQLVPIIASIKDEMNIMADQKKLELVNNIEKLPEVMADPERFKQILINLLSNAIKYTPSGKVEIHSKEDGKWVYVTVADSGIGISAEDMQNLFSKFYRIRITQTLDISGTGLGLWIAREIAEKMGGTLTVESIEGVGSHFTLKLKKA
ncbi:MAG: two-component sensor histidine kinase [uncultured bacterium]|nr:MAG: two-component sensor histidine kinase [uncultured bacterium]